MNKDFNLSCPIPISEYPHVLLAHGSGGILMNQLIDKIFRTAFANPALDKGHDGAVVDLASKRVAMTTDSYVVHPLFFPGGDIGSLAIHGTVNDLAMCGARPLYLSAGFILEEGLPMGDLWRIVSSMSQAAKECGIQIITGDTKVVDKGKADGIFITTTGIGIIEHDFKIEPKSIKEGDAIILSGDVGRHGIAIMSAREGLSFESQIESDSASVAELVSELIKSKVQVHCLRDLTRGGLATALVEIAKSSGKTLEFEEMKVPVREDVRGACEILGLDPFYVANEGRFICIAPEDQTDKILEIMNSHSLGGEARCIGFVQKEKGAKVFLQSQIGTKRVVDMLSGEQLPRIC